MRNALIVVISFCGLLLGFVAAAAPGDLEISDGSVQAIYHLEDVVDSSGNGYNLTNTGGATFATGLLDNAVDTGASNTSKYLNYSTNNLGVGLDAARSISLWVKLNQEIGAGDQQLVYHSGALGANGERLTLYYQYNGGTRRLVATMFQTTYSYVLYNTTLGTSDWHHLVIRFNGTGGDLWFDNSNVGSFSSAGTDNTTGSTYFGLGAVNGANFLSALIDETIFFNTEISTSTINSLYNAGAGIEVCNSAGCADAATNTPYLVGNDELDNDLIEYYGLLLIGLGAFFFVLVLGSRLARRWLDALMGIKNL